MHICPVCGKAFETTFALNGHLRLSTNSQHVSYTGKIMSRKHVHEASVNPSKQTDVILLELFSRLEAKLDALNKPQQQLVIKIETPVESKAKKMDWREYIKTAETSTTQSLYGPSDEYLNSLVERGFSPEYVRDRAKGKLFKSIFDDDKE